MLIDSHCHLNSLDLSEYSGDLIPVLNEAKENGVEAIVNVATTLEECPFVLKTAEKVSSVLPIYATAALHPSEKADHEPTVEELIELAAPKKVIAVGETGLDYHYDFTDQTIQRDRFRQHIRAAKAIKKPLIIHTREASDDLIQIMKEEGASDVGGVIHCFTEDWVMAKQLLDLDFYLGFSGIVTFNNANQLREVAKQTPIDRILVETDAPYLAPVPMRGKQNEPAFVRYVAEFMADLLAMPFTEFATKTTENTRALFAL